MPKFEATLCILSFALLSQSAPSFRKKSRGDKKCLSHCLDVKILFKQLSYIYLSMLLSIKQKLSLCDIQHICHSFSFSPTQKFNVLPIHMYVLGFFAIALFDLNKYFFAPIRTDKHLLINERSELWMKQKDS